MSVSEAQPIAVERFGEAIIVRFIRPSLRNPLSISVLEQLHLIMDAETNNQNLRKIIFTGTGDVFASGANLREIAQVTKDTAREFGLRGQSLMKKISEASQETIAAINGYCFGGALDLSLACHQRIASPEAVFCHPGADLGIVTGWGGTQRLPRLIGEGKALEMFLTAKRVSADEALRCGLIDEISRNPLESALANRANK
jgi:enoyl-CoA hydratase/carnithine racemase